MASNALSGRITHFLGLLRDIKSSDVFDQSWYRRQSTSALLSPSPVLHYMFFGWRKGLNPSPRFDTRFYIERYRDVRESRSNPLTHYMIHGRDEGRLATRSGRGLRESLHPEFAPLPIFGAPADAHPRLTVVVDDHTPFLLGVGYMPLLGLAVHTANEAGWSLRVLIRSEKIATSTISEAINATAKGDRPVIDISRRSPGPTDDVDATPTEVWWATSASSMESLRHLVDPSALWWIISADESARATDGEHRRDVTELLSLSTTRVIALGDTVAKALPKTAVSATVATLPTLLEVKKSSSKGVGVLVVPDHPECLSAFASTVLEYGLTHGVITEPVTLIGIEWEPLTFSGSVVVDQVKPQTAEEWSHALSSVDSLIVCQGGTEYPWLVDEASALAVATGSDSAQAVASQLSTAQKASKRVPVSWPETVGPLVAMMGSSRG
jgi:hypothetical protein